MSPGVTTEGFAGNRTATDLPVREFVRGGAVRRLIRGVTRAGIAGIAGQGASVLGSVAVARVLGSDGYGRFTLVQSTVLALTSFATLGLGVTATKYTSAYRSTDPLKAGRILRLSSIFALVSSSSLSAILLVLAPALIQASLVPELRLTVAYAFFTGLNGYQMGALVGLEAFGTIARITVVNGLLNLLLVLGLTAWAGLRGAVLAQGAAAFLLWVQSQAALHTETSRTGITLRLKGAWQERSSLFRCALPATLCGVLGSVAIWRCNLILVRTHGFADFAVFSAANTLRLMILFVPNLVTRVTSPALNNMRANGEWPAYRRTFWGSVLLNGSMASALAACAVIAGRCLPRIFGREFVPSTSLLLLLLSSVVLEVVAANLYQAIFTSRSLWWQAAILTLWSCLLISCSFVTIPQMGCSGLALSYLVAWSVSAVLYAAAARAQLSSAAGRPLTESYELQ